MKVSELADAFRFAAYRGHWREMMEYICCQYHDTTSVRSLIEGERNLQGFLYHRTEVPADGRTQLKGYDLLKLDQVE